MVAWGAGGERKPRKPTVDHAKDLIGRVTEISGSQRAETSKESPPMRTDLVERFKLAVSRDQAPRVRQDHALRLRPSDDF